MENVRGGEDMVLAVVAGVIAGFLGFVPLFASMRLSKKSLTLSTANTAMQGLVGVFVSLIVLAAALIVCAKVARDAVLPFGLAEMLALVALTSVYTLFRNGIIARKKR